MSNTNVAILKIEKVSSDDALTIKLEGRLDTTTAPQLEYEQIAMVTMSNIREKNKEVLITQMETGLYNRIMEKAKFADAELGKYIHYANYINMLYRSPSKFMSNKVLPPNPKNSGRFVMIRTLRNENITYESIKEYLVTFVELNAKNAIDIMENTARMLNVMAMNINMLRLERS